MSAPARTRERSFSWEDPELARRAGAGLSGLEYLQRIADGSLPPPPAAAMLGLEIVEVGPGRALFAMQPAEWMYNPLGSVHGGVVATLLDTCMGCAVQTLIDAGGYTTTDLQVRYVRPMTESTGRVLAEGTTVHTGRRLATAESRVWAEGSGKLHAHASTAAVILP